MSEDRTAPRALMLARDLWQLVRSDADRKRKVRWLASLLRPYRRRVVAMFAALLVATAAALAPPYLVGRAVDDGIGAGDGGALTLIAIAFIAAAAIVWVATYAQTYLVGWVGQRALQDLRREIYAHLQQMSIGFFSRRKPGILISRLTNDVQALDTLVTDGVITLVSSTLSLIGVAIILLFLDLPLALVTFLTFPLLAIASIAFRIASAGAYRATRERIAAITAYLQETLTGVRSVRSFGQEERHLERMSELNEANRDANMKTVYLNAAYFPSVELLSAIGTAVILLYGGYRVIDDQMSVGVLIAFVAYLQAFFDPIQQISQLYTTYQQGMAALDKIFELLDTEPAMPDSPDARPVGRIEGAISLEGVSFAYALEPVTGDDPAASRDGAGREGPGHDGAVETLWALRDVTLDIAAGETVALVGATGAGKSTLAKLICRFHDPQQGVVKVDGADVRQLMQSELRRQFGIVQQEGFLFSGTVRENIAFGRPDASDAEVAAAASAVGADGFIARLPDEYETEVGERGIQLSAGQRQLVAFSRALLADPRVLILDEATANVDVRTERVIEEGLERLFAGRTAVVIAHRLSTIQRADRIVVLEHGRIAEQGTHGELIAAGGRYAELYGEWAAGLAA